ncbi:MAG: rod shape-determining protein MreD [Acidimicrobiales bacterium]
MRPHISWPHALAAIVGVVVVQVANFDRILLADKVRIDLPMLALIGIGFAAPPTTATVLGFVLGVTLDLFHLGPFGFHALVYCLVAYSLAQAKLRALQPGRAFLTFQGMVAAAVVTAVVWLAGAVFGQSPPKFDLGNVGVLLVVACIGGIAVHPATRLGGWMIEDRRP